ncbi:hypothetical protein [Tenacibaculum sp. C7A-26P2]|uniref:hypothetical protein n=1 Tax=Tenacibaculum sp. C7A-26P2 TaxID=3447504 RepID=UPI003F86D7D2
MIDFTDDTYKRVLKIIQINNMNIRSFEERISVSNNSIGTAIRRKASFKSNVLNKILISFPEINPTWLLTGKGTIFLEKNLDNFVNEPSISYENPELNLLIKEKIVETILQNKEIADFLVKKINQILKN